jgi:predicted amidohydrolase
MKDIVRIGIIQMEILSDMFELEVREKNVEKCLSLIKKISDKQLDLVVLPEEFYAGQGYGPVSLPDPMPDLEEKVFNKLGECARENSIYIVGALAGKLDETSFQSNNLGFVIDTTGKIQGFQERIHALTSEAPYIHPGKEINIFDTPFGKISIAVGIDIFYPEIIRKMVQGGAEIICNPVIAAGVTEKEMDKYYFPNDLYKVCSEARALENNTYVVTVNGVGDYIHVELPIMGESMVNSPLGNIFTGSREEEAYVVEISIEDKQEAMKNFPLYEIRNNEMCLVP